MDSEAAVAASGNIVGASCGVEKQQLQRPGALLEHLVTSEAVAASGSVVGASRDIESSRSSVRERCRRVRWLQQQQKQRAGGLLDCPAVPAAAETMSRNVAPVSHGSSSCRSSMWERCSSARVKNIILKGTAKQRRRRTPVTSPRSIADAAGSCSRRGSDRERCRSGGSCSSRNNVQERCTSFPWLMQQQKQHPGAWHERAGEDKSEIGLL